MKKNLLVLVFSLIVVSAFATTIYDVQYTTVAGPDGTYPSTYDGQVVTVTGIVTAINYDEYEDNFFISMPEGGVWKGLYVFKANFINTSNPVVSLGDGVEVTGIIDEYYGYTELSGNSDEVTVTILNSGNTIPPFNIVQTADLVNASTAEQYECCLVEVNDVVVTQEQINFGQWYVTDTSATPCQIDDEFFYLDSVTPPIVITVGMTWDIIRGCLDYSYDEYGINPRTPDDLIEVASAPNTVISPISKFIGCYPNPFNPETTAYFNLAQSGKLELSVFNIKGEKVRLLVNEELNAGDHHTTWNGRDNQNKPVSSGIYFMFAESNNGDFTSVKKIILIK